MADPDRSRQLSRLLGAAGRAHHEAFGGPNSGWPEWYAEFLVANGIAEHVGFDPTIEQVADWLREADARHRADAPEDRWPPYYADYILDSLT